MAVLIVGEGPVAEAVIERLAAQGDDVRIVVSGDPDPWRARGALVALGERDDADLIERAAQNARSVVLIDQPGAPDIEVLKVLLQGAAAARVPRVIYVGTPVAASARECLAQWDDELVVLDVSRSRFLGFRRLAGQLSPDAIAEAVDAADDLDAPLRLDLDLQVLEAWTSLLLAPPPVKPRRRFWSKRAIGR